MHDCLSTLFPSCSWKAETQTQGGWGVMEQPQRETQEVEGFRAMILKVSAPFLTLITNPICMPLSMVKDWFVSYFISWIVPRSQIRTGLMRGYLHSVWCLRSLALLFPSLWWVLSHPIWYSSVGLTMWRRRHFRVPKLYNKALLIFSRVTCKR